MKSWIGAGIRRAVFAVDREAHTTHRTKTFGEVVKWGLSVESVFQFQLYVSFPIQGICVVNLQTTGSEHPPLDAESPLSQNLTSVGLQLGIAYIFPE